MTPSDRLRAAVERIESARDLLKTKIPDKTKFTVEFAIDDALAEIEAIARELEEADNG